ncbi:MAG: SH3 domain-containing protein [Clostridium sp.]
MKKSRYRRGIALLISCLMAVGTCFNGVAVPFGIVSYADERPATVNATNLNVRSGPGKTYPSVGKLSQGSAVTVISEQKAADGVLWYQIRFSGNGGAETNGYVSGAYIKFPSVITSDGDFEGYLVSQGFPESYKPSLRDLHAKYPKWTFTAMQTNLDWNTVIQNESIIGRNLVGRENISSWKSTATGAYDWNNGTWPGFDGNSWVQASEDIIRYYMDPRNFLNEKYIFQFLRQSYDSSIHTKEGLEAMVAGTFLSGMAVGGTGASGGGGSGNPGGSSSGSNPGATGPGAVEPGAAIPETTGAGTGATIPAFPVASITGRSSNLVSSYGPGMGNDTNQGSDANQGNNGSQDMISTTGSSSYVDIILNAAVQSGVNPYILATMIIQEQGGQGTGRSISGTVPGYQGYYNFFNIEAYQSGSLGAVERGLWWASQSGSYGRPWNSIEKSILGGSIYYGNNYVKQGQNTLYLKKFNVQGNNLYKHQYMTNVLAAAAEGMTLSKISTLKDTALEFLIPVFKNMPDTACVKPTGDGSPNNKLSGLGVEGFALTPTFNRDTESYDLIVDPSVASVTIAAAAIDSSASVSGPGNINLQSGNNDVTIAVKAGNGSIRNYVIHVVRQANGPTYSQSMGSGITSDLGGGIAIGPGATGGPGSNNSNNNNSNNNNSNNNNSGNASNVQIISPPGTSNGPMAPDGSH